MLSDGRFGFPIVPGPAGVAGCHRLALRRHRRSRRGRLRNGNGTTPEHDQQRHCQWKNPRLAHHPAACLEQSDRRCYGIHATVPAIPPTESTMSAGLVPSGFITKMPSEL